MNWKDVSKQLAASASSSSRLEVTVTVMDRSG